MLKIIRGVLAILAILGNLINAFNFFPGSNNINSVQRVLIFSIFVVIGIISLIVPPDVEARDIDPERESWLIILGILVIGLIVLTFFAKTEATPLHGYDGTSALMISPNDSQEAPLYPNIQTTSDEYSLETVSAFQKGYDYYQSGDYDQAFPLLLQAANDGYPDAEMYVGCCYRDGKGVDEDLNEAFDWFGLAANKGNAQAQYNYGYCYYKGDGVDKNWSLAFEWFQKSAEQNNKFGLLWTGYCYHKGIGVEKSYDNAYKYYVEARVHGNMDAEDRIKELNQDWGK
jgi:hypothetical protein